MAKAHRGQFVPTNPQKYIGDSKKITYRSSWEFSCMKMFDLHPHIIAWQSEGVSIPYKNPLTRRHTVYIPDFLIVYEKNGKKLVDMLEVKPAKEVPGMLAEGKRRLTAKDKLAQAINAAKWQAAIAYCAKRGVRFRVMTEHELFGKSSRR